jgi:pyridoxine 5-phosphate synthase
LCKDKVPINIQTKKLMTRLSVNLNKVALIRNARGSNLPNLLTVAADCESFGADGITVHPRPDERHIRYADVPQLKKIVQTEFNIEGYPSQRFMDLVLEVQPHQCTLVPDPPGVLTSDTGWDTIQYASKLKDIVSQLQKAGVRVSLFLDPETKLIEGAKKTGADRIEFYTGKYANGYNNDRDSAIAPFIIAAEIAEKMELGVNAGHDLNLENLNFFARSIPNLLEVSIGHALISDALYYGLHNTISMYKRMLEKD